MKPNGPQLERQAEWMDLRTLQQYADVSDRTLREWIHLPINPLPASQATGGKILVRRARFDSWLEAHPYQPINSINVNEITDEIIDQLREAA